MSVLGRQVEWRHLAIVDETRDLHVNVARITCTEHLRHRRDSSMFMKFFYHGAIRVPGGVMVNVLNLQLEVTSSTPSRSAIRPFRLSLGNTQPFYGSVEFVRENPGEPVPEETFTHYSHRSHQSSLSAFSI